MSVQNDFRNDWMFIKWDFKDGASNSASVSVLITCFSLSSFLFIFTSSPYYLFVLAVVFPLLHLFQARSCTYTSLFF